MTNDEALSWCKLHSVVTIHHQKQIILIVPSDQIDVKASKPKLSLVVSGGYVLAMSDPGDEFHEVVEAARASWKTRVSMIDSVADAAGHQARPARLRFEDQTGLFEELES